ncbi:MAG TPA: hypothetical protein VFX59_06330 [Polyangiales bacterium]|nr:hypothetical protein [Polyangiales bacterium]
MSLRRAVPYLLLLAACDDPAPEASLDASLGAPIVDTLDAAAEPLDAQDSTALDAAPHDAHVAATDARVDASVADASNAGDAGPLDCSTLGLTYDNYGAEFLYLWCNFCHAKQEPTFTTLESVRLWAPAMRIDTLDTRSMPPSGNANYLRDAQRAEFARWLDCGAP